MSDTPHVELRGSFPPIVTPFRDGEIDHKEYLRLLDLALAGGSHGIVVNGTTAEPSTLTVGERNELVDLAVDFIGGRVPVIAATGSQSFAETIELSDHATHAGADALLVVTPYYVCPPQRGLIDYYVAVCRRTPLPVLIYNIPGRAAVSVEVEAIARIRDQVSNLVGVKHASRDLAFVTDALSLFGAEFRIFVGIEDLALPMLALGASGMVNAVANIDPFRVGALHKAVVDGRLDVARGLHMELHGVSRAVFFDTNPIPVKYMMRRLGLLDRNEHRLPLSPATEELERRLDIVLEEAGLLDP
jgi:4-hydroxy-tetrahydrodipicolinate synthase